MLFFPPGMPPGCYYQIKTSGFMGSELGQNSHTKAKGGRPVYAKNTHPAIHACFVRGCYETSASSMAVVFPTAGLCSQDGSGNKQPQEGGGQVQQLSQEVVICEETPRYSLPTGYHFLLTFSPGQRLL